MSKTPKTIKFLLNETTTEPTIDVDGNPWTLHAVMIRLQEFKSDIPKIANSKKNSHLIFLRERFSAYLVEEAGKGLMNKELRHLYQPVYDLAFEVNTLYRLKNVDR